MNLFIYLVRCRYQWQTTDASNWLVFYLRRGNELYVNVPGFHVHLLTEIGVHQKYMCRPYFPFLDCSLCLGSYAETWVHRCRAQYHAKKCQARAQIETLPTSLNLYKCGEAIYAVLIKILQIYSQNMMFAHFIHLNNTTMGPDVQFPWNPLQSFDNWRYQSVIHFYMSHHDAGWIFWGVDTLPRSRCRRGNPITCSNPLIKGLNCHLPPQLKSAKDRKTICKVFVKIL